MGARKRAGPRPTQGQRQEQRTERSEIAKGRSLCPQGSAGGRCQITAIPELLRVLQLAGCIVTIEAMGCQTKIASEICHAGADYVLALKGNQSTLHEEVEIFLEGAEAGDFKGVHCDFLETNESAHGRLERRRYWITEDIGWLTRYGTWAGLRCAGMIESTREIQGQSTTERRFYIASIGADARTFSRAVRGH